MFQKYITKYEREFIDNKDNFRPGKPRDEAYRLLSQKKARENFELLVWLLGYRDVGVFHQAEMKKLGETRFLGKDKGWQRLWLWSRGFFKTTLITVAHSIYLMLNNPNIRILLVANTLDIAKFNYNMIRAHFTDNDNFRFIFKEFCPKAKGGKVEFGTTEQFYLPNRTKIVREPTVMCAGINTNLTGLHFDVIKEDDLVTKDSVANDTQIQASKDYHSYLRPFFDSPKEVRQDVVGTIYHFNDLYKLLIDSHLFEKSVVPAKDKDGKYLFPERVDEAVLEGMLDDPTVGPNVVYPQYLLTPFDPSKAKFKEEWISYYDEVPAGCASYICVDPASTQKKKSDYSVLERWDVDSEGIAHLVEGYRDKFTAFGRIDKLFEMAERCTNLKWVKYEVIGGRHGDLEVIAQRQREKKIYFEVKETKASNASKTDRIEQRLVGQYHAGKIKWPRQFIYTSYFDNKVQDFIAQLKLEYLQFPTTEHDDALDCSAQLFEDELEIIKGEKEKEAEVVLVGITGKQYHEHIENKGRNEGDPWKRLINLDRREQ